ncbi:polymorphic toxin-type HINT domain-containing protein [Streptomyces sp. NPDC002851]
MKDNGARFTELNKELKALADLKLDTLEDPAKAGDPKRQEEELTHAVRAFRAAEPHLKKLNTDLAEALRLFDGETDSLLALSILTIALGDYYPEPRHLKDDPTVHLIDWGKELAELGAIFDDINAGFDQMNRGLAQMNAGVAQVNKGLEQANRGIAKANRGMAQMNEGIAQANRGMAEANKAIPGIKKGAEKLGEVPAFDFDFSHIGDTWGSGSTGLDTAEQERRMGLLLDLIPGISDGKGIVEAVTGKDMATGEKLSGTDRLMGSVTVLHWLKTGRKVLRAEDVRKGRKPVTCATGNSFIPGTPVLLADGSHRPIEQVRVGDQVQATDPESGRTESAPVTALITGKGEKNLVQFTVNTDGPRGRRTDTLTATDHHPFWTEHPTHWTDAADLKPGMRLRTSNDTVVRVNAVKAWTARHQTVHNLSGDDLHTYYASAGHTPVLVHNSGPCVSVSSAIDKDPFLTKAAQQAGKNEKVQRDLDHMFEQLSRGNMNPGISTKALAGTDVTYARSRNGARLFFRNVNGKVQIVGKADKGNEPKVIARLKQLYGQ